MTVIGEVNGEYYDEWNNYYKMDKVLFVIFSVWISTNTGIEPGYCINRYVANKVEKKDRE